MPVSIGGCSYVPPIPIEAVVKENFHEILSAGYGVLDTAIQLCPYVMKTQIFLDGNKRAAVILANHYIISHGEGFIVIPEKEVPVFKKFLVEYYEGADQSEISIFLKEKCWRRF